MLDGHSSLPSIRQRHSSPGLQTTSSLRCVPGSQLLESVLQHTAKRLFDDVPRDECGRVECPFFLPSRRELFPRERFNAAFQFVPQSFQVGNRLLENVSENVHVDQLTCGFIRFRRDQRALARLLASCDVLVHPGDCETFGLIVLEAMACGLPVVGTTGGGVAELVDDSTGLLVAPNNVGSMAAGIEAIFRRDLGRMSMAACYKATREVYEDIASKNAKFKKIYEPWKQFRSEQVEWFGVAEARFDNFMRAAERLGQRAAKK